MNFIFNGLTGVFNKIAETSSGLCIGIFYEPEVPESLK